MPDLIDATYTGSTPASFRGQGVKKRGDTVRVTARSLDRSDIEPADKPLSDMTVAQLREHATAAGVDLGGATRKAEILKALTTTQEDN